MQFTARLTEVLILTALVLLWARRSNLDLGLRAPAMKGVWRWVLLFILWCAVEAVIVAFRPVEVDPEWLEELEQLSVLEEVVLTVLLGPALDELLFRGALFSALMRRWGIWAALLVPSALWGVIHIQYEALYMASIAGSGVVLAVIRWKSGSLYVPLALHAAFNLYVMLSAYLPVPSVE